MNNILFPLLRDFKTIPPTIAIINFLAEKGFKVLVFTYHTEVRFNHQNVKIITCSKKPYPYKSILKRARAKTYFHLKFYDFFLKNKKNIEFIWLGAWDVKLLYNFKGKRKLIYHFHELEEKKYNYCRKSDYLIVPEENRGWITFFQAKLKNKPLLLPNIPFYSDFEVGPDTEIMNLKEEGKIVIMYSGLIDNKKRNLLELVTSVQFLPDHFVLVIIPSFIKNSKDEEKLKKHIHNLKLEGRIFFLKSRTPPFHLNSMMSADIGVGFYSPSSLNNIYAAPNRLYEFVNNGTPVILPNFPSFVALSNKYPFAVNVADSNNPQEISDVMLNISKNKNKMIESIEKFKLKEGNYDKFAQKVINKIFLND